CWQLARMRIKAAMLGVVDARAEVGTQHLGHALEVLGNRIVGVGHSGGVLCGSNSEQVGALQRVRGSLTQEALDHISAGGATVHPGEGLEGKLAGALVLEVREEAIGLELPYRGDRYSSAAQCSWQPATEVDAPEHVVAAGIEGAYGAAQPALGADFVGLSSVPYIHRPEVRTIRVRIANAIDNGDAPLIPQALDGPHAGMEAKIIIDGQDILGGNMYRGAEIVVQPIAVWHNGIEAVIAAAQLDDDKRFVSYGGRHGIP